MGRCVCGGEWVVSVPGRAPYRFIAPFNYSMIIIKYYQAQKRERPLRGLAVLYVTTALPPSPVPIVATPSSMPIVATPSSMAVGVVRVR